MGKGKRKQADHRADTRGAALSGLPHVVFDSAAYLSLSPFERAVLAEILRRFNGYNNGEIGISYEEIGERLKGSNRSLPNNGRIARAVVALIDRGLIAEPTAESWLQRRARTYRLTFITSGKAPPFRSATNDYLQWTPRVKNDGDAESPEKPQSGDARSPEAISTGDAGSPDIPKNGSFACDQSSSPGDAGSLLIGKPYPAAETDGSGWWAAGPRLRALAVLKVAAGCRLAPPDQSNVVPFQRRAGSAECELCGETFSPRIAGVPQRFCGATCRKRSERQRARKRKTEHRRAARVLVE